MARISILMPFRDAEQTLPEALGSILGQSFTDWELLAVNDRSRDASAEIVAALAARDKRVRLLENRGRRGIVGALETGAAEARAGWIARMDADDVSSPRRLERQWEAACGGDLEVISCRVELLSPQGGGMERYVDWVNSLAEARQIANARFIECPLVHPSVMLKRDLLRRHGGYREVPWAEDHDLWLRLLAAGARVGKVPETLLRWRDSPARLTRRDSRYSDAMRAIMRAHFLARLPGVKERGVAIAGAGPIGKRMARDLRAYRVPVKGFFEVHPRRIGEKIQGAEVAGPENLGKRWREAVLLSAVGVPGGREDVLSRARAAGYEEGEDLWAIC